MVIYIYIYIYKLHFSYFKIIHVFRYLLSIGEFWHKATIIREEIKNYDIFLNVIFVLFYYLLQHRNFVYLAQFMYNRDKGVNLFLIVS